MALFNVLTREANLTLVSLRTKTWNKDHSQIAQPALVCAYNRVRQVDGSSHHVALNNGGRQVAAHGFHLIDFYEKGIGGGGL